MVNNRKQHTRRKAAKQEIRDVIPEPNEISASTPYDFRGKNLTPYGGLLPVATMLEKLGFQALVEENVTVKRVTKVMNVQMVRSGELRLYDRRNQPAEKGHWIHAKLSNPMRFSAVVALKRERDRRGLCGLPRRRDLARPS